ncbi:kinase-like domain-containing protein [Aspergillus keveii]|uniref:Kinase-like domain-containing protein n=1 Tax=Aspergillus keveii TaxID=714993 RepID=A0ABR4GK94_9EURO
MAGPVRQPIDIPSLERYIAKQVPEIIPPLDVKQFGFGQSNPTYLLTSTTTGSRFVLRKKPPGKLLSKTAHQVEREYRILHALRDTDVPVPKVYVLCEDADVIGTAFYIMEFLDGRFITDPLMPGVEPGERREMWRSAVETLVKLHTLNYESLGLSTLGKPSGFYTRQIKTFTSISRTQSLATDVETKLAIGPLPHLEEMTTFFSQNQPADRTSIVHGDYKIDNIVFHKTEPRVIGVLDWEMATLGHPLSDVVSLVSPFLPHTWGVQGTSSSLSPPLPSGSDLAESGLPTLEECIGWYTAGGGYADVRKDLTWGRAFAGFRGAVIMQGIAARYALRQASSASAKEFGAMAWPTAENVWGLVREMQGYSKQVQGSRVVEGEIREGEGEARGSDRGKGRL